MFRFLSPYHWMIFFVHISAKNFPLALATLKYCKKTRLLEIEIKMESASEFYWWNWGFLSSFSMLLSHLRGRRKRIILRVFTWWRIQMAYQRVTWENKMEILFNQLLMAHSNLGVPTTNHSNNSSKSSNWHNFTKNEVLPSTYLPMYVKCRSTFQKTKYFIYQTSKNTFSSDYNIIESQQQ